MVNSKVPPRSESAALRQLCTYKGTINFKDLISKGILDMTGKPRSYIIILTVRIFTLISLLISKLQKNLETNS